MTKITINPITLTSPDSSEDSDSPEVMEALQNLLREKGLSTEGNKKTLEARLKASQKERKVEAVLHRTITLPEIVSSDDQIALHCQDKFRADVNVGTTLTKTDGKKRWGNVKGHATMEKLGKIDKLTQDFEDFKAKLEGLAVKNQEQANEIGKQATEIGKQADEIEGLKSTGRLQSVKILDLNEKSVAQATEIKGLKATNDKQATEIERQAGEIQGLKVTSDEQATKIDTLNGICKELLKARSRFFVTYRRDVKGYLPLNAQDKAAVKEGNEAVHFGNPLLDAYLFERKIRKDSTIYTELYGLSYRDVLDISEFHILIIIPSY